MVSKGELLYRNAEVTGRWVNRIFVVGSIFSGTVLFMAVAGSTMTTKPYVRRLLTRPLRTRTETGLQGCVGERWVCEEHSPSHQTISLLLTVVVPGGHRLRVMLPSVIGA